MGNEFDENEDVLHDDEFNDSDIVAEADFEENGSELDADVFVGISGDTESE